MAPKAKGGGWCVCKYCRRSNKDTVNPWVPSEWQGRDQGDSSKMMLQFRRDRRKECSSCCALIRSNKRDYFVDPNLDKVLEADANKQSEFLQDLEEFESKKRSGGHPRKLKPNMPLVSRCVWWWVTFGHLTSWRGKANLFPRVWPPWSSMARVLREQYWILATEHQLGWLRWKAMMKKSASKVSYHESNFKMQMFCEFIP